MYGIDYTEMNGLHRCLEVV